MGVVVGFTQSVSRAPEDPFPFGGCPVRPCGRTVIHFPLGATTHFPLGPLIQLGPYVTLWENRPSTTHLGIQGVSTEQPGWLLRVSMGDAAHALIPQIAYPSASYVEGGRVGMDEVVAFEM